MANPATVELAMKSCTYRARTVRCPHQGLPAQVVAAKWKTPNGEWTSWKIVDCPLLPAGLMDCEKSCLSQLEEPVP